VPVATALSRLARGPGAFDQGAPGMGMASCGESPLSASRPTRICGGDQAPEAHERSGGIDAGAVPQFSHRRDCHHTRHATQGLERVDHGVEAPRCALVVACLFTTLEACGVLVDRADICLTDELLGRGGADHLAAPSQVRRAPSGLARSAAIVAEPAGVETTLGGLEVTDGLLTRPGEITPSVVCHCGDIDGGAVARTHQPRPWHRVPAVGCAPSARLFRHQRRGDAPADVPLLGQIPRAPIAAGASFVNEDELMALGLELTEELVEVTRARADRPELDDLRAMVLGHGGDRHGLFGDSHSDLKGGRLGQG
jgi:hypothetical protein